MFIGICYHDYNGRNNHHLRSCNGCGYVVVKKKERMSHLSHWWERTDGDRRCKECLWVSELAQCSERHQEGEEIRILPCWGETREHLQSLFARETPSLAFFCLPPSCQCRVRTSLVSPLQSQHSPSPAAGCLGKSDESVRCPLVRSHQAGRPAVRPVEPLPHQYRRDPITTTPTLCEMALSLPWVGHCSLMDTRIPAATWIYRSYSGYISSYTHSRRIMPGQQL